MPWHVTFPPFLSLHIHEMETLHQPTSEKRHEMPALSILLLWTKLIFFSLPRWPDCESLTHDFHWGFYNRSSQTLGQLGVRWRKSWRAGPEGQSNLWLNWWPPSSQASAWTSAPLAALKAPQLTEQSPVLPNTLFPLLIKHFLRQIKHVHSARIVSSLDFRRFGTKVGLPRAPEPPKDSPFPPQARDLHWHKC